MMELQKLLDAGLPVKSIWRDAEGVEQASFERPLTRTEWSAFLSLTDPAKARRLSAKENAKQAENLKTLTIQEAGNYIDKNVTTLAGARAVLKVMARLLISLRDEIYPDLPES